MRTRQFLYAFVALACLSAAARPVVAQTSGPAATGGVATTDPVNTHWDAHPVGKYILDFTLPDQVKPVEITFSDSAGKTVASFWPVGDIDAHQMEVTVKDTTLLLHAVAPRGAFDIVLFRRNEQVTGHWTMGPEHGTVKGKITGS